MQRKEKRPVSFLLNDAVCNGSVRVHPVRSGLRWLVLPGGGGDSPDRIPVFGLLVQGPQAEKSSCANTKGFTDPQK